jgi:hypothetical protein
VVGLLIEAFCGDLVARRFEPSGEGRGAVMACLQVGTCRLLRSIAPAGCRQPGMFEVHGFLLSP